MKNINEIHGLLFQIGLYDRDYILNDAQKAFFHLRNFTVWSEMSGDSIDMLFRYEERMSGTIAALQKVNNYSLANELLELSSFYNQNEAKINSFEDFEERIAFIMEFKDFQKLQDEISNFVYQNEEVYFENNLVAMNENLLILENTSKEIEFWNFLHNYIYEGYDVQRIEALKNQSTETLIQWHFFNKYFYKKAHQYNIWCAAEIVRNGCGDDSFHYFRNWLILQGYDIYNKVIENPDNLLSIFKRKRYKNRDDVQADSFSSEIDNELKTREIEDFELWLAQNNVTFYNPKIEEKDYEDFPNDWLGDEKSLSDACPEIYLFFRKNPLPHK